MTYQFAAQFGPEDLRSQNVTTKTLVNPTSIAVYNYGTAVLAGLFTDKTMATAGANPLATGVATNTAGVDAVGNVCFFVLPGSYDILINGTVKITRQLWPDPADLAQLSTASVASLQAWVIAQITAATSLD
jgi:hypothetical protein